MDEGIQVIYNGGYMPDLGIVIGNGQENGWLFYRHPDEKWVSLVDVKPFIEKVMLNEKDPNQ